MKTANEQLLEDLVRVHRSASQVCIARLEWNPVERDEIWSDVMSAAWTHIDELAQLSDLQARAWFLHAAKYQTLNTARRAMTRRRLSERLAREPFDETPTSDDVLAHEDDVVAAALAARIHLVLTSLRGDYRLALLMHANGANGALIAEELNVSLQGARHRLMRARAAFARIYTAAALDDFGDSWTESVRRRICTDGPRDERP